MTIISSKMLATLAMCATVLMFVCPWSSNAQATIPAKNPLYVFGDSLYDTGTALYIPKGPAANATPYGMTYFHKPAGRFSDGRVIPDFIAQFAMLPFPVPYWNPNLTDYTQAVNFADAAAGVLVETRPDTLNLKLQTSYFLEMTQKLEQKYGLAQTKTLLSKAVYLFNIGANDYTDFYNKNRLRLTTTLKTDFMNKVLGNFTIHITTMYNKGARKFAFHNSAPMGCLPTFLLVDGRCNEDLNSISRMHNDGLKAMCQNLTSKLPGFNYSLYNFYPTFSARLSNGASYGFTQTQSACCGSGRFNGQFTCSDPKANFTVCSDPTTYLWFDAGHPTQKAYQQFAQEFWGGSLQYAEPRNLKSFFSENLV